VTDSIDPDVLERALSDPDTRVLVIGGGVAGLVAARDCARPGFDVTVLEATPVVGGLVAAHQVAGITLDAGAESFATRGGGVAALIDDLGLTDRVAQPNPAGAWLQLPDRAVPMPKAGLLGIPSSPLANDVIAAIGWGGALRAYLDRLMPSLKIGQDRNLGALVRRRMGRAVLERLVAPVASGVYSADPDKLDVTVAAPGLNQAITRVGSLSGAVADLRGSAKAGSAVGGLVGGMSTLVTALVSDLEARGGRIRTNAAVTSITDIAPGESGIPIARDPESSERSKSTATDGEGSPRWRVTLASGETLDADAVLLALPGSPALDLLRSLPAPEQLSVSEWPHASSVELVTLVLDAPELDSAPRGTGMLVADDVPAERVTAKALTHATAKWAWLAEVAGPGRHVLRLSYGRAGTPNPIAGLDDAGLRDRALKDASALLNMPLEASTLVGFARTKWTNALPFAALGQRERIAAVRGHVERFDGIEVTGTWLAGTGLASVVPDAREAATRLRALRWRKLTAN
jgi:oxygen-dependent protoporphyrinogen oxidase